VAGEAGQKGEMDDVKRIVWRALKAAIIFFSHAGLAAVVYITFFYSTGLFAD
jgi:hypothetical protein